MNDEAGDLQSLFDQLVEQVCVAVPTGFKGELTLTYRDEAGSHTLAEVVRGE